MLLVTDTVGMPPVRPVLSSAFLPVPVSLINCLTLGSTEMHSVFSHLYGGYRSQLPGHKEALTRMTWNRARHGEQETAVSGGLS